MILGRIVNNKCSCVLCSDYFHEESKLVKHLIDCHYRSPLLMCREERKNGVVVITGPYWKNDMSL